MTKKTQIFSFVTLFSIPILFASFAKAQIVNVHVNGQVSSVSERGLAIGTTGVSSGEDFDLIFEYDLDQGEFLSGVDSIRQSYAEQILSGPWPYPGMSAHLRIGNLTWDLVSEEMNVEAHVMLDQRESLGAQLFNLRLRTRSDTLDGFHAHIFDSSINMGIYDGEEPWELFEDLAIPTRNSDLNLDAVSYVNFVLFSSDPENWEGNSWEIKLQNNTIDITTIPEPATIFILGLAGLALRRRR